MKKFTFIFALIFSSLQIFAQRDTSIWMSEQMVEQNNYIITIPQKWKSVTLSAQNEFKYKFELTGIGVKPMFKDAPVTAFMTLKEIKGDISVDSVLNLEKEQLLLLKDRIVESSAMDFDTASISIKTGETGTMLHTRYYRRVKVQNYSTYYFAVKHPKNNDVFLMTMTFTYKDSTYKFEFDEKLKNYAERVFSKLKLR